jgi:hypothetical protein
MEIQNNSSDLAESADSTLGFPRMRGKPGRYTEYSHTDSAHARVGSAAASKVEIIPLQALDIGPPAHYSIIFSVPRHIELESVHLL